MTPNFKQQLERAEQLAKKLGGLVIVPKISGGALKTLIADPAAEMKLEELYDSSLSFATGSGFFREDDRPSYNGGSPREHGFGLNWNWVNVTEMRAVEPTRTITITRSFDGVMHHATCQIKEASGEVFIDYAADRRESVIDAHVERVKNCERHEGPPKADGLMSPGNPYGFTEEDRHIPPVPKELLEGGTPIDSSKANEEIFRNKIGEDFYRRANWFGNPRQG